MSAANWEAEELSRRLRYARKQGEAFDRQLASVRHLWREGRELRQVRRIVDKTLRSNNMQWLAAYDAFKVPRGESKRHQFAQMYVSDFGEPSIALQPHKPITERFGVRHTAKSRGGFRSTFVFGHSTSARHVLMDRCMEVLCRDGYFRFQAMYRGMGRRELVSQIRQIVTNGSYRCVAVMDISDFFGSISHDFLLDRLPFRRSVTFNNLLAPMTRTGGTYTEDTHSFDSYAHRAREPQRGIPQGASCSPRIAYAILESVVALMNPSLPLFQYGDDIVVFGRDRAETSDLVSLLRQRLREHPAGPFAIGRSHIGALQDPFEFMQLRFGPDIPSVRHIESPRPWAVTLTAGARARFFANIDLHIADCIRRGDVELFAADDYISDWLQQAVSDDAHAVAAAGRSFINTRALELGLLEGPLARVCDLQS